METIVIADTDVVIDFFCGTEPVASAIAELIQEDLTLASVTLFSSITSQHQRQRKKLLTLRPQRLERSGR